MVVCFCHTYHWPRRRYPRSCCWLALVSQAGCIMAPNNITSCCVMPCKGRVKARRVFVGWSLRMRRVARCRTIRDVGPPEETTAKRRPGCGHARRRTQRAGPLGVNGGGPLTTTTLSGPPEHCRPGELCAESVRSRSCCTVRPARP